MEKQAGGQCVDFCPHSWISGLSNSLFVQSPQGTASDKIPQPSHGCPPTPAKCHRRNVVAAGPESQGRNTQDMHFRQGRASWKGVGWGWGPKETSAGDSLQICGPSVCCQRKQIPPAGLSPCGGGIISSMKWQRREAMCSALAKHPVPGSAGSAGLNSTWPQLGGWPLVGTVWESVPHTTQARSVPAPIILELGTTRKMELLWK